MSAIIPNPSDYGISPKYGFLSPQAPLQQFSEPYYQPWDTIATNLPILIKSKTLEKAVSELPLLTPEKLQTDLDHRRAYVVLAFTIHAYVWHQSPPNATVPPQLSEPFLAVCEHLGMHPVISYAGLCTWNWRIVNGGGMDVDNMAALASFTGTKGEAAFYHVPVLVEFEGGRLMHLLLDALRAALMSGDGRVDIVVEALRETTRAFGRMGAQLGKLYSRLDAKFFYHEHRPFMAGGKGMEEKGLPRGMVFRKANGDEIEGKFVGGSAVQSSLFPFLDHVLGVVHEDGELFQEMRNYMPGAHREFLAQVSQLPNLRQYVERNESNAELCEVYDKCLEQLRSWRGKHIAIVSKYIVQPAREAERTARVDKLEVDGSAGTDEEWELQGTGGSALMPFLKQARDDTRGIAS